MTKKEREDRKKFRKFLDEAVKIVETWPAWKQACLGSTSVSTLAESKDTERTKKKRGK